MGSSEIPLLPLIGRHQELDFCTEILYSSILRAGVHSLYTVTSISKQKCKDDTAIAIQSLEDIIILPSVSMMLRQFDMNIQQESKTMSVCIYKEGFCW